MARDWCRMGVKACWCWCMGWCWWSKQEMYEVNCREKTTASRYCNSGGLTGVSNVCICTLMFSGFYKTLKVFFTLSYQTLLYKNKIQGRFFRSKHDFVEIYCYGFSHIIWLNKWIHSCKVTRFESLHELVSLGSAVWINTENILPLRNKWLLFILVCTNLGLTCVFFYHSRKHLYFLWDLFPVS